MDKLGHTSTNRNCRRQFWLTSNTHPLSVNWNTCISLQSYTVYTKKTKAANPRTSRYVQNNTRVPSSNNNPLSIGVVRSINCNGTDVCVCVCVCVCVWTFLSKTNRLDWKGDCPQDKNTWLWTFCGTYSVYAGSSQLNFVDNAITHSTLTPCTPFLWRWRSINLLSKSILHGTQGEKGDAYEPQ